MENSRAKIMGIINVNNDSFFKESRAAGKEEFRSRVTKLLGQGADILDIGAVSSRPGAIYVSEEEEWRRLEPVLRIIDQMKPGTLISIDTFRSGIVRRAFDIMGNFIVNDISAGSEDPAMLRAAAEFGSGYIAMHREGSFITMHENEISSTINNRGRDIVRRVITFFEEFDRRAADAGLPDYVVDPGFGFSKNIPECLDLLKRLSELKVLGKEILVGISNKRMVSAGGILTQEQKDERMKKMHRLALEGGATILRVHDVAAAREVADDFARLQE